MKPGLLAELLAKLSRLDVTLSKALVFGQRRPRWPFLWLAHAGAHLGDSWLWTLITWLLWRSAARQESRQQKRQIWGWLTSFSSALGASLVIKQIFKRRRPSGGQFLYGRGADVHSFPSGHAARSGVIWIWAGRLLLPGASYWRWLLPFWIGWSRVALGIHYVGDVLIGYLLGIGVGRLVQRWVERW